MVKTRASSSLSSPAHLSHFFNSGVKNPNSQGFNQHFKGPMTRSKLALRQGLELERGGTHPRPVQHPFYLSSEAVSKAGPCLHKHLQLCGGEKEVMEALEKGIKVVQEQLVEGTGGDLCMPYMESCMLLDPSKKVEGGGLTKQGDKGYFNIRLHPKQRSNRGMTCHAFVLTAMWGPAVEPQATQCMHSCNQRECVNPWHLAWGTPDDNHRKWSELQLKQLWVQLQDQRDKWHQHWVPEAAAAAAAAAAKKKKNKKRGSKNPPPPSSSKRRK